MAAEWYYSAGGEKHGPVSAAELRHLATNGQLQSDHLVWKDGLAQWVEARKIKGLFPHDSPPLALSRSSQPQIGVNDNSSPSPTLKPVITKAVFFFFDNPNLPQAMSTLGKVKLAYQREYSFDQLGEGTIEIRKIPKTAEWTKELTTPTEENQYLYFGLMVAAARKYTQEQSYNNICRMYILHNMERIIRDEFGIDRKRDGSKVLYGEIDHGGYALLLDRQVPLKHWKFNLANGVSLQSLYADFDASAGNATAIETMKSQTARNSEEIPASKAENVGGAFTGPYFESSRPSRAATCSDDSCPCPGATILPGFGYLYISKEVIEFRKDAIAESAAAAKIQDVQRKLGAIVANPNLLASPILMCKMGAEKRGIDLAVASYDAQHWWKTGQVPLRPTPMAGQPPLALPRIPQPPPIAVTDNSSSSNSNGQQSCRYCGEQILAVAKKCRFCGEWLDKGQRIQRSAVPIKVVPVWNIPFIILLTLQLYWVFWFYRIFKELHARNFTTVTPGTAVGCFFIPFYNFYWLFVVFAELKKAIERAYEEHHLSIPQTGWIWVMPVVWLPGSILTAFAGGAGIPFTITAASLTLCFVQSWMNRLAAVERV